MFYFRMLNFLSIPCRLATLCFVMMSACFSSTALSWDIGLHSVSVLIVDCPPSRHIPDPVHVEGWKELTFTPPHNCKYIPGVMVGRHWILVPEDDLLACRNFVKDGNQKGACFAAPRGMAEAVLPAARVWLESIHNQESVSEDDDDASANSTDLAAITSESSLNLALLEFEHIHEYIGADRDKRSAEITFSHTIEKKEITSLGIKPQSYWKDFSVSLERLKTREIAYTATAPQEDTRSAGLVSGYRAIVAETGSVDMPELFGYLQGDNRFIPLHNKKDFITRVVNPWYWQKVTGGQLPADAKKIMNCRTSVTNYKDEEIYICKDKLGNPGMLVSESHTKQCLTITRRNKVNVTTSRFSVLSGRTEDRIIWSPWDALVPLSQKKYCHIRTIIDPAEGVKAIPEGWCIGEGFSRFGMPGKDFSYNKSISELCLVIKGEAHFVGRKNAKDHCAYPIKTIDGSYEVESSKSFLVISFIK